MNMPLVLLNRRRRGGSFSPYSLFSGTAIGTWFDPSDLTTMYQDAAGTTPVTAPGQPVGLRLDKSKGLALGAELVANGDFSVNTTGWTAQSGATLSIDAGRLKVVTTSLGQGASQVLSGLVVGKTYKISIDVTVGGADWNMLLGAAWAQGQGFDAGQQSTSRTYSRVYTCTNTAHNVLSLFSYGAGTTYFDNISVRELAGNHATQSVLASRPVYGIEPAGGRRNLLTWSEGFDNAAWSKTGLLTISPNTATAPDGTMTAERLTPDTSSSTKAVRAIVTSAGANTWSFYAKADGYDKVGVWDYATSGAYAAFLLSGAGSVLDSGVGASSPSIASIGNGWYRCSFTATVTGSLGFSPQVLTPAYTTGGVGTAWAGNGTSGILIWGAQLELGSTATPYQRVTSAFDVTEAGVQTCHYVQYDGSDDGMITNSIDFTATDKMSVFAGVRKLSDAATASILSFSANPPGTVGAFELLGPAAVGANDYRWTVRGTSTSTMNPAGFVAPITNVLTGIADISGDIATLRANGTQAATSTSDLGTGTFGNHILYIGRRGGTGLPLNGRDYGILVVGKATTAEEIASTEKWLASKTGVTI